MSIHNNTLSPKNDLNLMQEDIYIYAYHHYRKWIIGV